MQKKIENVRRVYRRAISLPLLNVEEIWKKYDIFENEQDKAKAKKNLSDVSVIYMTARSAMREMSSYFALMQQYHPPYDLAVPPQWSENELQYLKVWKEYLTWEKSNPLKLEALGAVRERVRFTYKKALTYLRFYPEVWLEMTDYVNQFDPDMALEIIKDARTVLPESLSVNFMYAELCEIKKDYATCEGIYKGLKDKISHKFQKIETKHERHRKRVMSVGGAESKTEDPSNGEQDHSAAASQDNTSSVTGSDSDESESDDESEAYHSEEEDRSPDFGDNGQGNEMEEESGPVKSAAERALERKLKRLDSRFKAKLDK
ncbi:mRNA 3'-end-processing protein rna14, partial [Spiromyces aspiralis]